jgi:hypothetical protein
VSYTDFGLGRRCGDPLERTWERRQLVGIARELIVIVGRETYSCRLLEGSNNKMDMYDVQWSINASS